MTALLLILLNWQVPQSPPPITPMETPMTHHISGTFSVKMIPQEDSDNPAGMSRFQLDKTYEGALTATGKGTMVAGRTAVPGSAGYVAIEMVTGTLDGRTGSFMIQHSGLMGGGTQSLTIAVIPDSGTGELTGLSGEMGITIEEGKHFYTFDYTLPKAE